MVVVVPAAAPINAAGAAPLFGVLHVHGVPTVTLRIQYYSWWKLGRTCVHGVMSSDHEHLVGKWFDSLAAAAQHCHHAIAGSPTDYMRTVKLPLRDKLPSIITDSPMDRMLGEYQPSRDPWAVAHADARVQQAGDLTTAGELAEIGKCRPFIPPGMHRIDALDRRYWVQFRAKESSGGPSGTMRSRPHSLEGRREEPALPMWERKRDEQQALASQSHDAGHHRKKRHRRAKIPLLKGACVWEGNADGVPPVAFVIREIWEDKGDETRAGSVSLYLESLEPDARRIWRQPHEVSNFDAALPTIYGERRALLTERGVWDATAEMVRRAFMDRLLTLPDLSASHVWRLRMKMTDFPCPVTEEEATEWRRAHAAPSGSPGSRACTV